MKKTIAKILAAVCLCAGLTVGGMWAAPVQVQAATTRTITVSTGGELATALGAITVANNDTVIINLQGITELSGTYSQLGTDWGEVFYKLYNDGSVTGLKVEFNGLTKIPNGPSPASSYSLQEIRLPDVTEIGNYAFWGFRNLQTVYMPKATTLGTGVFDVCSSLAGINIGSARPTGSNAAGTQAGTAITIYYDGEAPAQNILGFTNATYVQNPAPAPAPAPAQDDEYYMRHYNFWIQAYRQLAAAPNNGKVTVDTEGLDLDHVQHYVFDVLAGTNRTLIVKHKGETYKISGRNMANIALGHNHLFVGNLDGYKV